MNSPEIVAALRQHAPEGPGELYDSQADSLYQYCWLMLRNRETAQVAVRDAIVAAEAHIGRLADPELQYSTVEPVHQYYYAEQGPTYSGPGDFAPYRVYRESAVGVWSAYSHPYHYGYHPHMYGYHHGYAPRPHVYYAHPSMRYGYRGAPRVYGHAAPMMRHHY